MKTIIFILTCLFLTNCTTSKQCAKKFPSVASVDSVYIEKLKEVPIYLPGDSIEIEVPIDCPDQELVYTETNKLKQEITILNKKLISKTKIKPDTIIKYVTETETIVKEVKIPEIIKETPLFWKITGKIGIASILILIALIGFKMKNIGKNLTGIFKK